MEDTAVRNSGLNPIEVAAERGDIFELNIASMAEEVWGKENMYYALYKRLSDTTHGHWSTIEKHHLIKSMSPLHNGLLFYNENQETYEDHTNTFMALSLATNVCMAIVSEINSEEEENGELDDLQGRIKDFKVKVGEEYMRFFNSYVVGKA